MKRTLFMSLLASLTLATNSCSSASEGPPKGSKDDPAHQGSNDAGEGNDPDGDEDAATKPGDGDSAGDGDKTGDGDTAGDGDKTGDGDGGGDGDQPSDEAVSFVGAADIASCDSNGDEQTAALLDDLPGTIFLAGDIAYDDGTPEDFASCFDTSWGRHKARMRPALGNHEYYSDTGDGAPYFDYFGAGVGERGKGWYSYELGAWHVVVLNSNCGTEEPRTDCAPGSEQETWLREDLKKHPAHCTLAYFHHPLFSSGDHGSNPWMKPIWQALEEGGVDLVLTGHDHHYERFAPQDSEGNADPQGIRSFIIGTGGRGHYPTHEILPNSEIHDTSAFGLLSLTLRSKDYDYRFVPVTGATLKDEGTAACSNDRSFAP